MKTKLILFLSFLIFTLTLQAQVSNTTQGTTSTTIQGAIDSATAGDVIEVDAGTYSESINVDKALDIRGANYGVACNATRSAESKIDDANTTVTISSDNASIDGFTINGNVAISSGNNSGITIQNNIINADQTGISVTVATTPFKIINNCIKLSSQITGTTPQDATIGILISNASGTNPITIQGNDINDAFYGYIINDVDTNIQTTIQGGEITGVMQGVSILNTLGGSPISSSNINIEDINVNSFSGDYTGNSDLTPINFHAGVYSFTAGATTSSDVTTIDIDNITVDGTGSPQQSSAALAIYDFSSNSTAPVQIVDVTNSTFTNNDNRGVDARGYVDVTVTESSFENNGAAPEGSSGNDGFTFIAQKGGKLTVSLNDIKHPSSSTTTVTALRTGNGSGNQDYPNNSISASGNSIIMNGNTDGSGTSTSTGSSIDASCNWWGTEDSNTIDALVDPSATFSPFLTVNNTSGTSYSWDTTDSYVCISEVNVLGDFASTSGTEVYLNCDQSIRTIEVEVLDDSGNPIQNEDVSASVGTGSLSGTTTQTTDASGIATFDDLSYSENTDLTIQFEDLKIKNTDTTKTINSLECDINEIWTNYGGLWNSSTTSPNNGDNTLPDKSHDLLAFEYNGINYSTGVNDSKLTTNGVSFTPKTFRALPVATLPTTGSSSYFIGLGQLADGIDDDTDDGSTNPFEASSTDPLNGTEIASFLTDGVQGLDLGTNATNIPGGSASRFNLSSAGITASEVGDGTPDILVAQTAKPSGSTDQLKFVNNTGATIGNIVDLNIQNEPKVGDWKIDFYEFDSTGAANKYTNTSRGIYFYGVDLADFGITSSNAGDAVALIYSRGGKADVSFIAFNQPSMGVVTQLTEAGAPSNAKQNCDGTLNNPFQIQLEDQDGNAVAQSGLAIKASLESGPGSLAGKTTVDTNGSGVATFSNLSFTTGGNHKIKFSFAGLDDAITATIGNATGCDSYTWTGSTSSAWNNAGNWTTPLGGGGFPDGNNAVSIPDVSSGSNRYPILVANAGTGNLTMASAASIDLNGFELALNGTLTVNNGSIIDASVPGSNLFISSAGAANLPADFISNDVANFTVENATGATISSTMNITEVLDVRQGTLTTGGNITMKCFFDDEPATGDLRRTAQIDEVGGTISGDVTVEQCFPGRRAFRYVSASTTGGSIHNNWQENPETNTTTTPIQYGYEDNPKPGYGTHITGLGSVSGSGHSQTDPSTSDQTNGLDWQPSGNPSMYSWQSSQAWNPVLNTNAILNAGDAYIMVIRGSRAVDLNTNTSPVDDTRLSSTGTVAQGDVTVTPGISNDQFTLIGNPYHAAVDMDKVLNPNSGYNNFIYVFDPNLGGNSDTNSNSNDIGGRGGYVTVSVGNNTTSVQSGITGVMTTEANKFLQPYQSVFIQAAPSVSPGAITFKESYKNVNETQIDVFNTNPQPHIFVNLFDEESFNNLSSPDDGLVIYFSSNSSNAVNANDATKLLNTDESIARIQDGNKISFENRALPKDNEVLALYTDQYRTTNYKLEIGVNEFQNKNLYLYDSYLDEEVALNNDDNYIHSFTVDESNPESVATDRFEIRFDNTTLGTNDFDQAGISIYPNPVQDKVTLNLSQLNETVKELRVNDISGRLINNYTVDNQENYEFSMSNYPSGLYIVRIETETGVFQHKLIKE